MQHSLFSSNYSLSNVVGD